MHIASVNRQTDGQAGRQNPYSLRFFEQHPSGESRDCSEERQVCSEFPAGSQQLSQPAQVIRVEDEEGEESLLCFLGGEYQYISIIQTESPI